MTLYTTSIHMNEESKTSAHGHSNVTITESGQFETNWVTLQVDSASITFFCRELTQLAVIARQFNLAVDEAIRKRVNDYETKDIVEHMATKVGDA